MNRCARFLFLRMRLFDGDGVLIGWMRESGRQLTFLEKMVNDVLLSGGAEGVVACG